MTTQVSDTSSHRKDQIANFAEILSNAPSRQRIFDAIYFGKKKTKSAQDVANVTKFSRVRVTMIAKPMVRERMFEQDRERIDGTIQTVYRKIDFVESNKRKILSLARSKKKLSSYPTKSNPRIGALRPLTLRVPFRPRTRFITISDVHQFKKVRAIKSIPDQLTPPRLPERAVKVGILRLLEERKIPNDWPGESNDIFSVKLRVRGRTLRGAFALKGPAKKGTLVPAMMGKNGDQIQRLFASPADAFFVQYEGEIAESIVGLMEQLAKAKALLGTEVFFGIIDRDATYKLRLAYPKQFKSS